MMKKLLALTMLIFAAACAPREVIYPLFGMDVPRLQTFPKDFVPPISNETGLPVGGFGGGGGGVNRVPVIFVHGNTVSANFWLPARQHFADKGYTGDELWAPSYGWNSVRRFDTADLSVPTLEAFVNSVQNYLSEQSGRPIRQVDVIGHSLGVTLVRQWMTQENAWHRVRNFVAACGANDGVWTARPDARGASRGVAFELYPGSPWLQQLRRHGDTPGPTRVMTLYDGTGWGDVLFPKPYEHAGALKGARNLAYNLEHGTHYDHLELPRVPETMDAMIRFFEEEPQPLPQAEAPRLVRAPDHVRANQPDAQVFCETGGIYPSRATAGVAEFVLADGALTTCYARHAGSGLSSPMARYKRKTDYASETALTLRATPSGGVYEQPQSVSLTASDPEAFIVYTTSGSRPTSGSPLYDAPVYIAGPLKLTAVAIAPDGRQSEPLQLNYDISLELLDTRHSLQRQFDAEAPSLYTGQRKKGN